MSLHGAIGETVREGKEVLTGTTNVTTSVAIATPFAIIDGISVSGRTAVAPGLGTSTYTHSITGNVVTIHAWQPTSAANPTLIAATLVSTVCYTIIGRRVQ